MLNRLAIVGLSAAGLAGLTGLTSSPRPRKVNPSAAGAAPFSVPHRATKPSETFNVGMLRVEHFGRSGAHALIFIPALFCGSWQWNREIDSLSSRYDLYALTLPGFDGRPPVEGGHLMSRAALDLSQLIHNRKLVRPIIIGHSLGGTLAVMFAEKYPDDPGAIIAVEGGYPVAPTDSARKQRVDAAAAPYEHATPATLGTVLRAQTLRFVITNPDDVNLVEKYAARSDPSAIAQWLREALSLDLTNGLATIRVPLLEIVPFDANIDPYQGFKTLAEKKAAYTTWLAHAHNGSLSMIDHSRHFVMFDRPSEFDHVLLAAIRHDVAQ